MYKKHLITIKELEEDLSDLIERIDYDNETEGYYGESLIEEKEEYVNALYNIVELWNELEETKIHIRKPTEEDDKEISADLTYQMNKDEGMYD